MSKHFSMNAKKSLTISEKEKVKRSRICFPSKKFGMASTPLFIDQGLEKLPHEVINDFILCIISLLQNVALVSGSSTEESRSFKFRSF